MLTADQLDSLVDPITELYERYQVSVIQDIARRLAGLDYATSSAAWQMQRLTELGAVYENALWELSTVTGQSESVLREMFEKAGVKAMRFDDSIYRQAGLKPLPLNLSPAMAQVLAAGLRKTEGIARNLTMSTAISSQAAFVEAADLAYLQISSGAFDYQTAINTAVKNVAEQGLTVINYASGRHDQLDVAMRRAVLTGVNQTVGNLQERRMDELGVDLVQTSAHVGARNKGTGPANHESWQGKVFSRSGEKGEYKDFVTETGYGTATGLSGINCRHSFYPFFGELSENAYNQATLDQYAEKKVTYQDREMSFYEGTQKQRAIERKIRQAKRVAAAQEAAGLDSSGARAKVKALQGNMREFTKQTGIRRQYDRERAGFTTSIEKLQGKPLTANQLLEVAEQGKRSLTDAELGQVVDHIASAGFDPTPNSIVPKKYDGWIVDNKLLRQGDRVPTGYLHYAKHVQENVEWPTGTSYNEYIQDLQRVVRDPQSLIVLNKYPAGELQLSFMGPAGKSKGINRTDWIVVNYRVNRSAWMTGNHVEDMEKFLEGLGEKRWLRRVE